MIVRILAALVLLAAIFGGIFGWKYKQGLDMAAAQRPPPPATVSVAEVETRRWERTLFGVGSLVASQGVYVTSEVAGQVEAITFDSGQRVEAGAPLLELDASVDRADLEGLVAEVRLAEAEFRRAEELLAQRTVARSEYDRLQAQLAFARAQAAAKRAQVAKKSIRAPFAGLIGIRQVNLGEYLAPGARIVLLQSLDPVHVDYTVPERFFDELVAGQEVEVSVQSFPGMSFRGRVSALDPGIDPGTRSVRVRATLDNRVGRLRPGMFASVRTLLGRADEVTTVPRTAITYAPYGDSVFVVGEKDGQLTVQRRQVETGEVREGRVAVLSGLAPGDRVVSAGQLKLRNGQAIAVDNSVQPDGIGGGS